MVNANFATEKTTRKSTSGIITTIGGTIAGWMTKSQKATALSNTESEYYAMSQATQDLHFVQNMLKEMGIDKLPGILFKDNVGAILLARNQQVSQRTKHIDTWHHFMQDVPGASLSPPGYCSSCTAPTSGQEGRGPPTAIASQ